MVLNCRCVRSAPRGNAPQPLGHAAPAPSVAAVGEAAPASRARGDSRLWPVLTRHSSGSGLVSRVGTGSASALQFYNFFWNVQTNFDICTFVLQSRLKTIVPLVSMWFKYFTETQFKSNRFLWRWGREVDVSSSAFSGVAPGDASPGPPLCRWNTGKENALRVHTREREKIPFFILVVLYITYLYHLRVWFE